MPGWVGVALWAAFVALIAEFVLKPLAARFLA